MHYHSSLHKHTEEAALTLHPAWLACAAKRIASAFPPATPTLTQLKRRLLRQEGWAVVSVDPLAWERLRGAAQKRAHLLRLLEEAVPAGSAVGPVAG